MKADKLFPPLVEECEGYSTEETRSLESIFSYNAPESLCDSITNYLLKDPLFFNGNTYSKETWIKFNGIHPITQQPFQLSQCQRNLDKEKEVDDYLTTCLNSLAKSLDDPTSESLLKVLDIIPLLDQRSCCLNASRLFKSILSRRSLIEQFQNSLPIAKVLDWNEFINIDNDIPSTKSNNNNNNSNNNNVKSLIIRNQKMIDFLLEKRKDQLDNLEVLYGVKIKRDFTLQISSNDQSLEFEINKNIDNLVGSWKSVSLHKSNVGKKHCQLIMKKLESRSKEDKNIIITVHSMPSFVSQKMDLLIDINGVDIIPSYISTISSNINNLLSLLVEMKPSITSEELSSLLKNEKLKVELLLDKHYSSLEGSLTDYILYSTSKYDWDQVNNGLIHLLQKNIQPQQKQQKQEIEEKKELKEKEQQLPKSDKKNENEQDEIPILYKGPNGKVVVANQKPSRTLFVRNIAYDVKENDIISMFSKFGDIRKKHSLLSTRGIMFISFFDIRNAEAAKIKLQDTSIQGRPIDIHYNSVGNGTGDEDFVKSSGYLLVKNNNIIIDELKEYFIKFGEIRSAIRNRQGQGLIEYYDIKDCEKAIKGAQGQKLAGQTISLSGWAPPNENPKNGNVDKNKEKNNNENNNNIDKKNNDKKKNNEEEEEEDEDILQENQKLPIKRQFRYFIIKNFEKKWKSSFPKSKFTVLHSCIKFEGEDRQNLYQMMKEDCNSIQMNTFQIEAPNSLSLYQPLIQKYQDQNQIYIEFKPRSKSYSSTATEKQYGISSQLEKKTNDSNLDVIVIGLGIPQLSKAYSYLKSLFSLWAKITTPYGDKIEYSQFSIPNEVVVSLKGSDVYIEAISKDVLKKVARQIQQKLSTTKIDIQILDYEMKYLKHKQYILQLQKKFTDSKIDIIGDDKLSIAGMLTSVNMIKMEMTALFKKITCKMVKLVGEEVKTHGRLYRLKLESIQRRLIQQASNVGIDWKYLNQKDKIIDFQSIRVFGEITEVETVQMELLSKSKINTFGIQSDNLTAIKDYLNDRTKKDNMVLEYRISDKTYISITLFDTDASNVEKDLKVLVSKEPKDTKIINLVHRLIFDKFYGEKKWPLMALEKGVVLSFSPPDSTITLIGNPTKVSAMQDEIEREKVHLSSQFIEKEFELNQVQYDIVSVNSRQLELDSQVLIRIPKDKERELMSLHFDDNDTHKSISLQHGNLQTVKVDCVVCPSNSQLEHGGGAAGDIARAAGHQFIDACRFFILTRGHLPPGQSFLTGSFNMKNCKAIINSVGPNLSLITQRDNRKKLLESSVKTAIEEAETKKFESIAIPAISSGVFGYPIQESAPILIETALTSLSKSNSIKHIIFIDSNYEILHHLKKSILEMKNHPHQLSWKWRENDGQMIEYDDASKVELEKAFKENKDNVDLLIRNVFYRVYFQPGNWHQINLANRNGNRRLVVRTPPPINVNGITIINHSGFKNRIRVVGSKESLDLFESNLAHLVTSNVTILKINKKLKGDIEEKILHLAEFNGVEMKQLEDGSYQLKGLQQKAMEIQIAILENTSTIGPTSYPPGWKKDVKQGFIDVAQGSAEWNQVVMRINNPMIRVKKIQVVQNTEAYDSYIHSKNRFKINNQDDNETLLFHGSRKNDPKSICFSRDCFDFRYGYEGGSYGPGSYFAKESSYSYSYAYQSPEGKQFFLAKVLLGESVSISPQHLKLPPLKPNSQYERYDSVKGNCNGEIYIVYDSKVSYPYYLITFN